MDLIDLFQRGGIAMYPILLCSVAAVTVFFERLWSLRSRRLIPKGFVRSFRQCVTQGRLTEAAELCDAHASLPLAKVARAGLTHHGMGPEMIRFMVTEVGAQQSAELERYQSILGTVSYISPLLGLFGTVSGMIKAFDVISKHTIVDPPLLAAGISEALITTFAGLAVAIPVVVMDRYVRSRSDYISREMDKKAVEITEVLTKEAPNTSSETFQVASRS